MSPFESGKYSNDFKREGMELQKIWNILSTLSIFMMVCKAAKPDNEDISSKSEELLKSNKNLLEKIIYPLQWIENIQTVFATFRKQKDLKSDVTDQRDGRFLDFSTSSLAMGGINRHDMLLMTLNKAIEDFGEICQSIADKFAEFVIKNQENLMERKLGERRLFTMLSDFRRLVLSQANTAVATATGAAMG
ncbi:UNVERIFIED_CONTAM: hypothetical protein RMT77_006419 [Armadillidium vulgare]